MLRGTVQSGTRRIVLSVKFAWSRT